MGKVRTIWLPAVAAVLLAALLPGAGAAASSRRATAQRVATVDSAGVAPGAPGAKADWLPADKQGFGTSRTHASLVWFTLEHGELSEIYYPRLDTPSFRDLQFVVTDGRTFAAPERTTTTQRYGLVDGHSLIYEQVNTDRAHSWRLTKTYVTDPARSSVVMRVRFQSLTSRAYRLYVLADPSLSNDGMHDTGTCAHGALLSTDGAMAAAVLSQPAMTQTSCGYKGSSSDGGTDLAQHYRLTAHYRSAPDGNVIETGLTPLTGRPGHQQLTLSVSFAGGTAGASSAARASLVTGFTRLAGVYARGWHHYLASLRTPPATLTTAAERREYAVSQMVLAASEDKTHPGAFVASPTMPWAWGTGLSTPSDAYHLVWSRDLYEIATALIADGDTAGARRALHFLFFRQQKADGSFPQNSDVTGAPKWTNLQLDEVADPIILAEQLRAFDAATLTHVKQAADFIVGWHDDQGHTAPYTPEERWENQAGYSPATIASEIAGLVCAADIAKRNGDTADAARWLATADDWRAHVNGWTVTTTGPYGPRYYLRLTKDGNPNAGTMYSIGDGGPAAIDQRHVVDPSFLELVRLGIKSAHDPVIVNTVRVVNQQLGVSTPRGTFWHRYTSDGYGEQRNGQPWNIGFPPGSQTTIGRLWPIFAGERGEYELLAGASAAPSLLAMSRTANAGGLLPEQVWDQNPPSGQPGFAPGTPTFSATPLAWTHAQFIRLAWSIAAGAPVEQPSVVACRYVRVCAVPAH